MLRPNSARRLPPSALLGAALCTVIVLAGCGDSRFLTGRYCSKNPVVLPGVGVTGYEEKWVALEVGHYGPNVGGMVGFHDDSSCGQDMNTDDRCPCSYIDAGVYESGSLTFLFDFEYITEEACEELGPACIGDNKALAGDQNCAWDSMTFHVALLPLEGGEELAGDLCLTEDCCSKPDCPDRIHLEFVRTTTSEKDFEIADKHRNRCEELFFGEAQ